MTGDGGSNDMMARQQWKGQESRRDPGKTILSYLDHSLSRALPGHRQLSTLPMSPLSF